MSRVIRFENRKYAVIAKKLMTEDPDNYSFTDIDDFASLILERSSDVIGNETSIPIEVLVENFGLCLITSSVDIDYLAILIAGNAARIEGVDKQKDIIVLRNNLNDEMYRFVAAYMLSIYLLEYIGKHKKSQKYYFHKINYVSITSNKMEEKAQRMARALLLPKEVFMEQYKSLTALQGYKSLIVRELINYFEVPEFVVKKRIEELEL